MRPEVGRRVAAALQRDAGQHEREVEPRRADARVRPVDEPDPVLVVGVDHDVVGAQVAVHEGVPGAHAQRLLLPADQLLDVRPAPSGRGRRRARRTCCCVLGSSACSLRQPVKSSASWSSVRGSWCPGSGSASASAPTASATARRSSGVHGSSGERPCTTSKPRITQSPSSEDHSSRGAGTCGGSARGDADLGAGEVGGDAGSARRRRP